jgi:hypothetical protein
VSSVEQELKLLLEKFDDGSLVTREEAVVMLTRCFLELRELKQKLKELSDV